MINYHPSDELLLAHAAGETSLAMAVAIGAHCELCKHCANRVATLNKNLAKHYLVSDNSAKDAHASTDWQNMDSLFNAITDVKQASKSEALYTPKANPIATFKGEHFTLPQVFNQLIDSDLASPWKGLGKVNRMRFDTQDGKARASLLFIGAGGEIPEHTHKGSEITLLLQGHFSDEFGRYGPGDFLLMDGSKEHTPMTKDGCLCYTVVDAPLHFTKGLSKLLNPIGELIY